MATTKDSSQQRYSRYAQGGKVEKFVNRLGWWERTVYARQPDDLVIMIERKFHKRPDLLAHHLYGRANLMWVLLQFNNIIDIETEFVHGRIITAPSFSRLTTSILTGSIGTL